MTKKVRYRSADDGKFKTKSYADKHRKTVIAETIKPKPKKKK